MDSQPPQTTSPRRSRAPTDALLAKGDQHWASKPARWRERELALSWPEELLRTFCYRMASHGMSVSVNLMRCDHRYALQQLVHAHNMADDTLRSMAVRLFRHSEGRLVKQDQALH